MSILTYDMARALRDRWPLCLLAELDHPSGVFRAWTGVGDLDYRGHVWKGLGILGSISPIKSATDLAIQEVRFSLSGVSAESLALLSPAVRKRPARAWLGSFNKATGNIVRDPFELLDCEMDTQDFTVDDNGMATLFIVARSGFYTLERAIDEVWSDQDQQRRFPGDIGLRDLASLQNAEVHWTPT